LRKAMDSGTTHKEDAPQESLIVERVLSVLSGPTPAGNRAFVTLSWAQTLNAVIGERGGGPAALSSPESLLLTHRIRSLHAGILVGIRTVISDDPLLSVRLVDGPQPQPVILDSLLRTPLHSRLMGRADRKPWIFHAEEPGEKGRNLTARGARLFRVGRARAGIDLAEVLDTLAGQGIGSLMVEGGAGVLSSFFAEGLFHQAVVTLSPVFMSGVSLFRGDAGPAPAVRFQKTEWESHGSDVVMWGMR
jgi:riboflavin-specific deaminase-like protein